MKPGYLPSNRGRALHDLLRISCPEAVLANLFAHRSFHSKPCAHLLQHFHSLVQHVLLFGRGRAVCVCCWCWFLILCLFASLPRLLPLAQPHALLLPLLRSELQPVELPAGLFTPPEIDVRAVSWVLCL